MTPERNPHIDVLAWMMLMALAAVWGGSFFFAELALRELPPLSITLHRVFWAVPMLYFILRFKSLPLPKSAKVWSAYLVMGALNNALPFSLIFWGQQEISAGLASIINAMTAMVAAVVAGLLLKDEPLTRAKCLGAFVGLIGVAVSVGPASLFEISLVNLAQIAVFAATFSYAFAGVWGKTMLSEHPPLVNAFGMLVGSSCLMIPIVLLNDGVPEFALRPLTVWSLLGLSLLSTALAYYLYFAILARAGAANLLLVTLLIPPFAIGLEALFLGERVTLGAWIGFTIIAIGFAITDGRIYQALKGQRTSS